MTGDERLDVAWVMTSAVLVLLMQAGFLCLETGFTRAKNSINVAIKNLSDFAIAVLLFAGFGFALAFGPTAAGWLAAPGPFAALGAGPRETAFFLFQMMFCATATTIVSGAVAERMRFAGYLMLAGIVAGIAYPVFAHWVWNGLDAGTPEGWLGRLGFVDFAGSTVVHGVAGWSALAAVVLLGPREGRFDHAGAMPLQGHNLPFAMLGALFLWIGWLGFNGGNTQALDARVPGIVVNTVLSGCAGLASALTLGWIRTRRSDVVMVVNGSLAGFVAITAGCDAVEPAAAIVIGAVGGIVMVETARLLERRRIDDVVGVIPVHAAAGAWGTVAVALFGDLEVLGTGLGRTEQFGIQLLGLATACVWTFGLVYLLLSGINRISPLRVSAETERMGLNVAEHGATTELHDLLVDMERQAAEGDLGLRATEQPFTEVGQIASRYNRVMSSLETAVHKADRIKDEFVSTVSHELRTPLTSIHASLGLVADGAVGPLSDEPRKLVQIARSNSERLVRLINELLDIQKIESGSTVYDRRPVEPSSALEQVVAANGAYAAERGVRLDIVDGAPGARVEADLDRLLQVLTNLLSNALKFSPRGMQVTVASERRDGWIRISVADRGPGIPEEFRERVFEKFSQADASDTRGRGGTGLGLSITRAIVEDFGGRIDFETRAGGGTRFFFELPELHEGADAPQLPAGVAP